MAIPVIGAVGKSFTFNGYDVPLAAGTTYNIPAGVYVVIPGSYTFLQSKDPNSGLWRVVDSGQGNTGICTIDSDGTNYRLANLTGCPMGAVVTNVGSGYTSPPTIVPSAGGSSWKAYVGGDLSSMTITSGGSNLTYPPTIIIDPPPVGGLQAYATCTISAGAINTVTYISQGAGYKVAPNVTVVLDPRDPNNAAFFPNTATPATLPVLTAVVDSGAAAKVVAVECTDPGTPVTAVPALTFSGGGGSSAAATAIMNFAVTAVSFTATAGWVNPLCLAVAAKVGGAASIVQSTGDLAVLVPRIGVILPTVASGTIQASAGTIVDSGLGMQTVPTFVVFNGNGAAATATTSTGSVGGVSDVSFLQPI